MSNKVEEHYTAYSSPNQSAPQWAKFRSEMLKSFPYPYSGQRDSLADGIDEAIRELDKLKPETVGAAELLLKSGELILCIVGLYHLLNGWNGNGSPINLADVRLIRPAWYY